MPRKPLLVLLLLVLLLSVIQVQAQQQLNRPANLRISDDTLHWDEIENASGYRVRWLGRNDWIMAEASQNRFSLAPFYHGLTYLAQVQALGDALAYRDSFWSLTYVLRRPYPTATPTNTPTATPTPTPTRVVLRGLRTPQLRLLSEATVAWNAIAGATGYEL